MKSLLFSVVNYTEFLKCYISSVNVFHTFFLSRINEPTDCPDDDNKNSQNVDTNV